MADENKSDQEKTEDPSQQRIDEFRQKGQVASSKELNSVLVLSATLMSLFLSLIFMYETIHNFFHYVQTIELEAAYTDEGIIRVLNEVLVVSFKCVAPVFLASFCIGTLAQVMQIGFLFAPEVIAFKLEKINPVNGFKRLFSMKAIFEAVKGVFKFAVIICITYFILKDDLNLFTGFLQREILISFGWGKTLIFKLAFSIVLGMAVVAAADFAWEKWQYMKKLRQTKQEAKDELKEKEGNPEIKQRIRSIQREMAQKRMMEEIPKADVIVTNPTHISVALKYDVKSMVSPEVIGLGADHLAMKIREIAKKHDIPIVENVPLARSIYGTVSVGDAIPRELYKAVAEVLAFVYRLKRRKKAIGVA